MINTATQPASESEEVSITITPLDPNNNVTGVVYRLGNSTSEMVAARQQVEGYTMILRANNTNEAIRQATEQINNLPLNETVRQELIDGLTDKLSTGISPQQDEVCIPTNTPGFLDLHEFLFWPTLFLPDYLCITYWVEEPEPPEPQPQEPPQPGLVMTQRNGTTVATIQHYTLDLTANNSDEAIRQATEQINNLPLNETVRQGLIDGVTDQLSNGIPPQPLVVCLGGEGDIFGIGIETSKICFKFRFSDEPG
jgi:hypothetical protein